MSASATPEQEETSEGQHIGVHNPLQSRRAVVQVASDGRQGDVHHRDVQDHHELGDASESEQDPVRRVPLGRLAAFEFVSHSGDLRLDLARLDDRVWTLATLDTEQGRPIP